MLAMPPHAGPPSVLALRMQTAAAPRRPPLSAGLSVALLGAREDMLVEFTVLHLLNVPLAARLSGTTWSIGGCLPVEVGVLVSRQMSVSGPQAARRQLPRATGLVVQFDAQVSCAGSLKPHGGARRRAGLAAGSSRAWTNAPGGMLVRFETPLPCARSLKRHGGARGQAALAVGRSGAWTSTPGGRLVQFGVLVRAGRSLELLGAERGQLPLARGNSGTSWRDRTATPVEVGTASSREGTPKPRGAAGRPLPFAGHSQTPQAPSSPRADELDAFGAVAPRRVMRSPNRASLGLQLLSDTCTCRGLLVILGA